MATATLDEILGLARDLTREEQQELRDRLSSWLNPTSPPATEEDLLWRLHELGLLAEVRGPITDLAPYEGRKPLEYEGKPLSEVIIEERG